MWGLFCGGIWVRNWFESWTSGGRDTVAGELVTVIPGSYTVVPINQGASRLDFAPPEMTVVEYLDVNEDPLPVYKNGQVEYSLITGPGVDDEIGAPRGLCFIRFSSAGSSFEYSFMFYQN